MLIYPHEISLEYRAAINNITRVLNAVTAKILRTSADILAGSIAQGLTTIWQRRRRAMGVRGSGGCNSWRGAALDRS
jgi:hypothetical protein